MKKNVIPSKGEVQMLCNRFFNIKNIVLFQLSLTLLSCSTGETFDQKTKRYSARGTDKETQILVLKPSEYAPLQLRKIASQESENHLFPQVKNSYFATLYIQTIELEELLNPTHKISQLNTCPQFHTSLLKLKKSVGLKASVSQLNLDHVNHDLAIIKAIYSFKEQSPVSKDHYKNNLTLSGKLNEYYLEQIKEINEMCENGNSNQYYKFENLLSHIRSNGFEPSTKNINILEKSNLYQNDLIINVLKNSYIKREISSIQNSEPNLEWRKKIVRSTFQKMNAEWAR